jgi:hypothetical protein
VHVQSVERFYQFVDDAHLVFPVRFVHAGPAEQAVEQAGLLQADVLDLLVVVQFGFQADAALLGTQAHLDKI